MKAFRIALAGMLAVALGSGFTYAHGPDPILGGPLWAMDQAVAFRWASGQEPPAALKAAILAGAADSNASKASRAATFQYAAAGASPVAYGVNVSCPPAGLACMSRANAPTSFTMAFREQGHRFDWGSLRWCQLLATPWLDGCFDTENIALDELGHVEILDHHVNFADGSDYLDAVVQTYSRAKPDTGWNTHAYGRCDVAVLQRRYDVPDWATRYSTCLDLVTSLGLVPSASSVYSGSTVTFAATLGVAVNSAYERMSGNPVNGRTVTLQRRTPGATTWTTIGTMSPGSQNGTYLLNWSPTATYEWRAVFAKPSDEGLRGATSTTSTVTVSTCTSSPCPQSTVTSTP